MTARVEAWTRQHERWEQESSTTMSDLDAMLSHIRHTDYLTGERLATSYTYALRIDTTYGTDLAPAIAAVIEQIATDLGPVYMPPF